MSLLPIAAWRPGQHTRCLDYDYKNVTFTDKKERKSSEYQTEN